MIEPDRLTAELLHLIGEEDLIALTEGYGGLRLFVPTGGGRGPLKAVLSERALSILASQFGGSYIRVPLARAMRARHYRLQGLSNAQIARKFGMTESGVDQLFARMVDKPQKGSADPRQTDLFAR